MKKFNNDFIKPPKEKLISLLNFYKARQYFEAKKFPEHQFAWKVLGAVLKQVGKIEESLIANQKSLELMPQDREAHNNLGVTLQELGRFKEAEVSFRKAILLKTDDADAYNNLGNILKKLNRFNEAEENYRKAIQLKVNFWLLYTATNKHLIFSLILLRLGIIFFLHCKQLNYKSHL